MSISIIPQLIFQDTTTDEFATVEQLREKGRYYRHPDSATISYPCAVDIKEPLGSINKPLKIAVIGGGISGVASIYELSKLSDANKNIKITLFESDHEHFAVVRQFPTQTDVDTHGHRAGRIFAGDSNSEKAKGSDKGTLSVYEIGAMRFPEIAGLTWHYVSVVFDKNPTVSKFSNPGQVPTEFVQGERTDRYRGKDWLYPDSPTKKLVEVVNKALFGDKEFKQKNISLFQIGGKDPAEISLELKSKDTKPERLREIQKEWEIFADRYDELTLGSAVKQIIRKKLNELPSIDGISSSNDSEDAKINYYVSLFGRFGFGTAGFRALFNISLAEMMRDLLWSYANEYNMPVKQNVEFVSGLYDKAEKTLGDRLTVCPARVCDVCHLDDEKKATSAAIIYYKINHKGVEDKTPEMDTFDYVILAVTPKQLSAITSRLGFDNVARLTTLGDYPKECTKKLNVRPPFILSNSGARNFQVLSAINQVHMMASLKIFVTIKKSTYNENAAKYQEEIKAIVSDCGLAATYVVPSPDPKSEYYTFMLSYTWEDDTKLLQNEMFSYPKNVADEDEQNQLKNRKMLNLAINRTNRDVVDPTDPKNPKYTRWWFGELLKKVDKKSELINALSYDWTTHHTSGAFKRDLTGDYYGNHFLFRYHTHALKAKELQNRFFLANDSYSHNGGWIEGALIGAVNAVCGLIVAANGGEVSALTREEARKIMTDLKPVA